ncbi:MAG: FAD-dependent oxidoreductase [Actinomycetota bacterium]|nr:FAD-dependent oxidoreductase [Actinomycetota bacterium]
MNDVLMVGNGPAAVAAIEQFRLFDRSSPITLVSKEDVPFYSPCPLAEYVEGSFARERLFLRPDSFYGEYGVEFIGGATATGIDTSLAQLEIEKDGIGRTLSWTKLLIATGAAAATPPILGLEGASGIHTLKTLEDADAIVASARTARSAAVIGSGFIGLEAAQALRRLGLAVTVIEALDRVLPQMLDADLAQLVRARLEANGVRVLCSSRVASIESGRGRLRGVRVEEETIPADLVVIATGVRPAIDWLGGSGIATDVGIIADDSMATSVSGVWAAGDVAQAPAWDGLLRSIPTWPNAVSTGRIAGAAMAGRAVRHRGLDLVNVVRVFGMAVATFGERNGEQAFDFVGARTRRRVHVGEGRITGGQFLGDISNSGVLHEMMRKGIDVGHFGGTVSSPGFGYSRLMPRPPTAGRHAA